MARVLVVFFLTLCALCFLGTYVISAKVMRNRIHEHGGDLVQMSLSSSAESLVGLPGARELEELLGSESLCLRLLGSGSVEKGMSVRMVTYDFSRSSQWLPHLSSRGVPTLLVGENSKLLPGPACVKANGQELEVFVRRLSGQDLLSRYVQREAILILQPDSAFVQQILSRSSYATHDLLLRVRDTSDSEGVRRADEFCRNYLRLEGGDGYVFSALALLEEMDIILNNQMQCRAAFCGGIAIIVGILLTALAGMEYRQNEYIYTLMKSFGIHPLLLVGAFIVENLLLVGGSFVAAVATFMYSQRFFVQQFFKNGNYSLELAEIMPELQLVAVSLLGCVLVSSIPIVMAANRDIGKVLK